MANKDDEGVQRLLTTYKEENGVSGRVTANRMERKVRVINNIN